MNSAIIRSLFAFLVAVAALSAQTPDLEFGYSTPATKVLALPSGSTAILGTNTEQPFYFDGSGRTRSAFTITILDPNGKYIGSNAALSFDLGNDVASDATLDAAGDIWVVGYTDSDNFPLVNPLFSQKALERPTGFVMELDPSGSNILFSSFLGGHAPYSNAVGPSGLRSGAQAIALDVEGNIYVTGATTEADFPSTLPVLGAGAPSGVSPGRVQFSFLLKMAPGGKSLLFSRLLGGVQFNCVPFPMPITILSATTSIGAIAINSDDSLFFTGLTNAADLAQSLTGTAFNSCPDYNLSFLGRLSSDGSTLVSSASFGDTSTSINFLRLDSSGDLYLAGASSGGLPVTANAVQSVPPSSQAGSVGFVAKLNADFSAVDYCTYLGSSPVTGITFDTSGEPWISGSGASTIPSNVVPLGQDFLIQLNPDASAFSAFYSLPNGTASQGLSTDLSGNLLLLSSGGTVARLNPANATAPSLLAIANAATLRADQGISPGEIATLFGINIGPSAAASAVPGQNGQFPTTLGGVQVLFNGQPAPLLYAGLDQINFQVPFEATDSGDNQESVQVMTPSGTLLSFVPAVIESLGIFQSSPGIAAALNQDLTVNSASNPAAAGTVIVLYVTGLSGIDVQQGMTMVDGQVATTASNQFGQQLIATTTLQYNLNLPILYAGPAPGLIDGISQVNVELPLTFPGQTSIALSFFGATLYPTSNTVQVYTK